MDRFSCAMCTCEAQRITFRKGLTFYHFKSTYALLRHGLQTQNLCPKLHMSHP